MYQALYRKYRSKDFDDLCGQDHISSVLRKQCQSGNISHAYLFCGTRGTGKTSSAKIFSKAINCEAPVNGNPCNRCSACREIDSDNATDVLEIDAASNNGVNNIRDLREEVTYPPSFLKKRVYIIDEVHMLTDAAFNALLKTLEEPPEYVVFILCTTELHKIPPTILSRCQRYDFRRIEAETIISRLNFIAECEGFSIDEDAVNTIAKLADGGMRDAISLLDSCLAGSLAAQGEKKDIVISSGLVERQLGICSRELLLKIFEDISAASPADALRTLELVHSSAFNLLVFLEDMLTLIRDMLIAKSTRSLDCLSFVLNSDDKKRFSQLTKGLSNEKLLYFSSILEDIFYKTSKYSDNMKLVFEIAIVEMCEPRLVDSYKALSARISALEAGIAPASAIQLQAASEAAVSEKEKDTEPVQQSSSDTADSSTALPRPYTQFSELLKEVKPNKAVWALLSGCRASRSGDTVIIYCNSLNLNLLTAAANSAYVENAVKRISGGSVSVKFVEGNDNADRPDLIDEIQLNF